MKEKLAKGGFYEKKLCRYTFDFDNNARDYSFAFDSASYDTYRLLF
jgi:hypothetical protein